MNKIVLSKPCLNCKKIIFKSPTKSVQQWNIRSKFCSKKCLYTYYKGIHLSPKTEFKKGRPEILGRIESLPRGEKSVKWKGNSVGYHALHKWVRQKLGDPKKCSNPSCVYPKINKSGHVLYKPKKFCWANISKKYLREISDWHSLCSSCNILDRTSSRVSPRKKETVSHWRSLLGVG